MPPRSPTGRPSRRTRVGRSTPAASSSSAERYAEDLTKLVFARREDLKTPKLALVVALGKLLEKHYLSVVWGKP